MAKKKIVVSGYERYRYGKKEKVDPYIKEIDVTNIDPDKLAQISLGEARKLHRKRMNETHPDKIENARLTFKYPNKFWKENMEICDTLSIDAKEPPIVSEKPKYGIPGQIVRYKGKDYLADDNGKFKLDR
jgi:hypothetical protein